MLTVIVAILCSLFSGAAGAFLMYRFYVPRLKESLRAELSGNLADWQGTVMSLVKTEQYAWQEAAAETLDARFSSLQNGIDDRILTAVEAAQPKLDGVTSDKPDKEAEEEKKSRGVEGTFCM